MIKSLLNIIIITVFITFSGCTKNKEETWTQMTNIKFLNKKMPFLSPISKSQWEQNINSGFIGPSNYTWRGFILINDDIKDKLLSEYSWKESDSPAIKCSFDYKPNWDCQQWLYNESFNNSYPNHNWHAYYFFCPDKNTLYFHAGS